MPEGYPTASPQVSSGAARIPEIMRRTRLWILFFGIFGLVGAGLIFFVGLVGFFVARPALGMKEVIFAIPGLCVYGLMGVFSILLSLYLLRYAGRIARYVAEPRDDLLADALDAQRVYWKFLGILTIVGCGLGFLSLVVAAIFGITRGFHWGG
ncbi:MAG: hypothetical protein K6U03_02370 [Firmicutes bacterium]|nr:hypothetical protein [Bacillota bacterium]